MKKIIIAIHGLSNKPPKHTLAAQWKLCIQQGLKNQGWPWRRVPIKMVYWADLFYPVPDLQVHQEIQAIRQFEPATDANESMKSPGKRKPWLDWLERDLEWIFLKTPKPNPFEALSDALSRRLYYEFYVYFSKGSKNEDSDSDAKRITQDRLKAMLHKHRKKQILLLSHSMGTIIAYDVLQEASSDIRVHTWMTMGSPLGQAIVMSKMSREQKSVKKPRKRFHILPAGKPVFATPECITHRWLNFSDLEDKIALNYALQEEFSPNSKGICVQDIVVRNAFEIEGKPNHHKSYGYLRTPQAASALHEFLGQSIFDKLFFFRDFFSRDKQIG